MRIDLGLAANCALFPVVGYAFLYAIGLARRRDIRLLGLSYLTGWALLGSALSFALTAGIPIGVLTVLLTAAVLTAACLLAGRRTAEVTLAAVPQSRQPLARLAVLVGAAVIVIDAVAAIVVGVQNLWTPDIDLMTAWMPRAQAIYYQHHIDPSVWGSFVTPWYPPLVPTMYAVTFGFIGGFHPSVLALQQTLLGLAFLLAVFGLLDRFAPRWISVPSLALLLSTPWFWWRLHSLLPDQTLAYVLVAGAIACVIWLYEQRGAWLALAVVFLAAASLTKVEGTLFAILLIAAVVPAAFVLHRRAALPSVFLLLAPAAVVPWRLWLTRHQVATSTPDYNAPNVLDPGFLWDRVHRLTFALDFMVRGPFASFGPETVTAVIVCLSIAVFLAVSRRIPVISAAVGAWLVLSFLALAAIYWTSRVEIAFYVGTSASRVGTTLIVAAGTLTPLLLGLALKSVSPDSGTLPAEDAGPGRPPAPANSGSDG
jgi:hypothetical protein